jgi:hypothetical protein
MDGHPLPCRGGEGRLLLRLVVVLSLADHGGEERKNCSFFFFRNGVSRPLHPKDAHSLFISIKQSQEPYKITHRSA